MVFEPSVTPSAETCVVTVVARPGKSGTETNRHVLSSRMESVTKSHLPSEVPLHGISLLMSLVQLNGIFIPYCQLSIT